MKIRKYESPSAFKQAMEQRLRKLAPGGVDFERRRQLLVFDRFLARVVQVIGDAALLKGGIVLELRLERARTTKDIDLLLEGSPEVVLETLRRAGRLDVGDFMVFEVSPDREHAEIQTEGMQANGLRYRVEARLGGRLYGQPFGVDVAFGDPIIGEPDVVICEDLLDFAEAPPVSDRISHCREASCVYSSASAGELPREGSAGHRPFGYDP